MLANNAYYSTHKKIKYYLLVRQKTPQMRDRKKMR